MLGSIREELGRISVYSKVFVIYDKNSKMFINCDEDDYYGGDNNTKYAIYARHFEEEQEVRKFLDKYKDRINEKECMILKISISINYMEEIWKKK